MKKLSLWIVTATSLLLCASPAHFTGVNASPSYHVAQTATLTSNQISSHYLNEPDWIE